MKPAFLFDARYCSGCKTCQAACKDKNALPIGVLWRRVYEVSGGSWAKKGDAWSTDVYAYNISMGCNHCEHPKCAGVCPTNAYTIRPDGIVILDQSKCTGCGYCAWACPYGAPQLDSSRGVMTKCDFCIDELDNGIQPACVSSCPMRSLELVDFEEIFQVAHLVQSIPPMTDPSSRNPKLLIHPHSATSHALKEQPTIVNHEEVKSRKVGRFEEFPLVVFTLLSQLAVGMLWALIPVLISFQPSFFPSGSQFIETILLIIMIITFCGLLISFGHMKNPINAWRVITHLNKSWLSREILFTILFGFSCLAVFTTRAAEFEGVSSSIAFILAVILGSAAIWSMARIYRLETIPSWDPVRTSQAFFVTAGLLGSTAIFTIYTFWLGGNPGRLFHTTWIIPITLLLAASQLLGNKPKNNIGIELRRIRSMLVLIGISLLLLSHLMPTIYLGEVLAIFLVLVLVEELIGRIIFYKDRSQQF
ncbi:DmsC/YnfH family molybdoenzyme membrane anchor subunit [Chloroflexota bacterium]